MDVDVIIQVLETVVDLEIVEVLETAAVSVDGGYGLYYYSSSLDGEETAADLEEIDLAETLI